MELYRKLLAARDRMSFEKEYNADLKYEILDADSILEMVGDALAEQGVLFIPSMVHAEMTFEAREKDGRNNTKYMQHIQHALATLELTFIDVETGESHTATTHGSAIDFGDKALGKAQTYAIKYFFARMFLKGKSDINDEERHDATSRPRQSAPSASAPASELDAVTWTRNENGEVMEFVKWAVAVWEKAGNKSKSASHTYNRLAKALKLGNVAGTREKFMKAMLEYKGTNQDAAAAVRAYKTEDEKANEG